MIQNLCKTAVVSCKETVYTYNLFHMVKAFFPDAEIRQTVDEEQEPLVNLVLDGGSFFSIMPDLSVKTKDDGKDANPQESAMDGAGLPEDKEDSGVARSTGDSWLIGSTDDSSLTGSKGDWEADRQARKKWVTLQVYEFLAAYTGRQLAWGMLTGVRPVKLAMGRLEAGDDEEGIRAFLSREYRVSEEKAGLAAQIAVRERELLGRLDYQKGFSLYIGIPFCPSICTYCSFSSSPIGLWKNRIEDYLDALLREIRALGALGQGRKLDTVYIGGGTPVTLEGAQLDRLLSVIEETFADAAGGKGILEYTVEAGRPDSITEEKLKVLRRHGISRISVNPQTMQQKTLERIGRRHTAEDAAESFWLARELGFDNINMDLIAGLPGETACDMQDTLRQIEALGPDSLTVHSLAIKRAARMGQEQEMAKAGTAYAEISRMVRDSEKAAARMGLLPYYLYRQKNIAGNFENVGYAKADKAGIYNILIMEEKQTILAAGAGTTTKIVLPEKIRLDNGKETNLIRQENVKDVASYIRTIDEIIEHKQRLLEKW